MDFLDKRVMGICNELKKLKVKQKFPITSIAEIWDQKTTKGVKVTYKDESGNHTLTFTKITGLQPSKPGDLDTPI